MAIKLKATKGLKTPGGKRFSSVEFFASVETEVPNLDAVAEGFARIYAEIDSAIERQLGHATEVPSVGVVLAEARRRDVSPELLRSVCVKEFARSQVRELADHERERLYRLLRGMNGTKEVST